MLSFLCAGGDGAGKQTQTRMLVERLSAEGYPVATLDFPHDHAMYGALIREILSVFWLLPAIPTAM